MIQFAVLKTLAAVHNRDTVEINQLTIVIELITNILIRTEDIRKVIKTINNKEKETEQHSLSLCS